MNSDPSRVKGRWSSISSRRKVRCQGTTRFVRLFFGSSDHSSQAGSSITGDTGGGSKWARWIYPQQLSDLICALWRTIDVVLVDGRKDVECIPQELPSLHTSLISAGLVLIKPASFPKQFKSAFPGNLWRSDGYSYLQRSR